MNAAKLLRQKILDLAIRGKLTKREKDDEPADVLLAHIAAEKQKLIDAKKIKKDKPLPPIADDEKPFDIPEGWEWCRLGDIGNWKAGATPSRHHSEYYRNGKIPWLKTGDLNDSYVTSIPEFITKAGLDSTPAVVNPVGTVLMAMYGATIGKLGILRLEAATNQACCACDLMGIVEGRYLFYYLMSRRENFRELGGGGAQPNISKDVIVRYPIPLPPLAEQKRIVSRAEELIAEVDKYSAAMDTLASSSEMMEKKVLDLAIRGKLTKREKVDEPAAALLARVAAEKQKLIDAKKIKKEKPLPTIADDEKPFDLPEGWEWCRLGDLSAYGQCTAVPYSELPKNKWVLDLEEVEKDTGRLIVRKFAKDKKSTSSKHVFKKGDLLYSKLRTYLNKVLIADMDGACTSEIVPIDFWNLTNSAYMRIVMMSPYFLAYTAGCDYGVKMPRLGTDDARKALVPLPPLAEQKRIVARVDELLAECRQMRGV